MFKFNNYLEEDKFKDAKQKFALEFSEYNDAVIFHVGTGAGFYSEMCSMMECIMYCYVNHIKFILYADDANFSDGKGWQEFFEEFCTMSHDNLNRIANYRYKSYTRVGRVALPNMLLKRVLLPGILKRREKVNYLTQDIFHEIFTPDFMDSEVEWRLFGINGKVRDEYCKLSQICLRYNQRTKKSIEDLITSINLPDHYTSIQIRGGDKTNEFDNIVGIDYCIKLIKTNITCENNVFIFTDDYRNIISIKEKCPELNVYTLTLPTERGYYNAKFNSLDWIQRRQDLIKLFSMVEICVNSDFHIGCGGTCVNLFIKQRRTNKDNLEYQIGKQREQTLTNKIKRIVGF